MFDRVCHQQRASKLFIWPPKRPREMRDKSLKCQWAASLTVKNSYLNPLQSVIFNPLKITWRNPLLVKPLVSIILPHLSWKVILKLSVIWFFCFQFFICQWNQLLIYLFVLGFFCCCFLFVVVLFHLFLFELEPHDMASGWY